MQPARYLGRAMMLLIILGGNLGAAPSAPRVKFEGFVDLATAAPGSSVRTVFEAKLPDGFHVNSNAPLEEFLKPTRLELETPAGVSIRNIVYPKALLFKTRFSEEPLAVYEHRFLIGASLDLAPDIAHGEHALKATLKYQACTDRVCFPPAIRTTQVTVRVAAATTTAPTNVGLFDNIVFGAERVD